MKKRAEAGTPQEPTMTHPTNPAGYGDSGKSTGQPGYWWPGAGRLGADIPTVGTQVKPDLLTGSTEKGMKNRGDKGLIY